MELPKDPKPGRPLWENGRRWAREYWLLIFFAGVFSAVLGYLAYDLYHPDTYQPKPDRDIAVSDAYVAGWNDGRETTPAARVTMKPSPDGSFTGTVEVPKGRVDSSSGLSVPDIYMGGWAQLWANIWDVLKWILGFLAMLIGINLLALLMVGGRREGQARFALMRLFSRAVDQQANSGTQAANSSGKEEGSISITVIKPQDNKFRLADFIGEPEVMAELVPFIESAKAQRIAYQANLEEEKKRRTEENKKNSNSWQNPNAIDIPIPEIPEGRYGHIQNTKFIIEGEPGTGKSLFPLVAAGEAGITLVSVAGTFENVFIGAGAKNVRALVAKAKENAPCIIFMDEGEEGAKQRSKEVTMGGANSDGSTAALLKEIDGVESKVGKSNGLHWVLATNYVGKIDEAMKRSGRLKVLKFNKPSLDNLKRLLTLFFGKLKKLPLAPNFDPTSVASMLLGKTGADIEELTNQFAGLAEEIANQEEKRLNDRREAERKRLSETVADNEEVERQLQAAGLHKDGIEKHLSGLTFGHTHFIEAVLRLLMGRKKMDANECFYVVRDTAWHEGMHGLANAAMQSLKLLDWKVRFFTVGHRQRTLGLMYPSPDTDESLVSIANVLARSVVAYAGGMAQLVGHDDYRRWGDEIDLYRDSGTASDNEQAAQLIHQSISKFGGSLRIGPISKGQGGHTWFTEMGPDLVDDIDKEVRLRQKLAQFLAWRLSSIFMQNETTWEIFDEVLNSPDRIILQDRFYELFDKIMSDRKTRSQIMALPSAFNKLAADEDKVLSWKPGRQPLMARWFIQRKTVWLEARYKETRRQEALHGLSGQDLLVR